MVDRIEQRFDQVDRRFDAVDRRFDAMDRRFERIEDQLVTLRRDMHMGFMIQTTAILSLAGVMIARSL